MPSKRRRHPPPRRPKVPGSPSSSPLVNPLTGKSMPGLPPPTTPESDALNDHLDDLCVAMCKMGGLVSCPDVPCGSEEEEPCEKTSDCKKGYECKKEGGKEGGGRRRLLSLTVTPSKSGKSGKCKKKDDDGDGGSGSGDGGGDGDGGGSSSSTSSSSSGDGSSGDGGGSEGDGSDGSSSGSKGSGSSDGDGGDKKGPPPPLFKVNNLSLLTTYKRPINNL